MNFKIHNIIRTIKNALFGLKINFWEILNFPKVRGALDYLNETTTKASLILSKGTIIGGCTFFFMIF